MAPNLTIRNLTSSPVELKLVERYESPGGGAGGPKIDTNIGGFGDIGRNLTNIGSFVANTIQNATTGGGPSSAQLADDAQSFSRQDVNVRVEPFTTNNTDIRPTERSDSEIMRLTIECDGQRYRIDTPSPKHGSQTFTPLQNDSRHEFTGVFLPGETYLAVFSSSQLHSWMRNLPDETPLSALSIPGTHNSPTCHRALPSVRCQAVPPREQLDNGVRFFDIRVQPEAPDDPSRDGLVLVHGVFPVSLTGNKYLRELVDDTLRFLDANPSETVIFSLKREGPGQHTDQQLCRILRDHYAQENNDRWFTAPRVPTLGEARRRIVLLRRFALDDAARGLHGGAGYGLDAENWRYNCDQDAHGDVCVQDFCEVNETLHIDDKVRFSLAQLGRAAACRACADHARDGRNRGRIFLNFLSASNFWKMACWPEKIAARLNPEVVKYLCQRQGDENDEQRSGDGGTGVVVCDWVGENGDWDLVRCIVGMNSKLQLRR